MTWSELQQLLADSPRVALYLTIEGCAPCKAVRPWVEAAFDAPPWRWLAVDTAESPELAGQLLVFAHPTLILFVDGREQARFSRVVPRAAVMQAKQALA